VKAFHSVAIAAGCALAVLSALPHLNAQAQRTLTVGDLYSPVPLIPYAPGGLTWAPNGEHLTYMDGGELVDLDPATAKAHILVSREKLAALGSDTSNEKDKDHRARYGQASYLWAPDSEHLLFDTNGRLWIYDLKNGVGLAVGFSGAGSGDDPKFSPDGHQLSFIKDHGLQVIHLKEPGTPMVGVASAGANVLSGEVDWVYEEELSVRSNYFWSPDSSRIAYLQMDENHVLEYPITDWIPVHPPLDMQRYPLPGDPNPDVKVGIVSANGGKTVWVKLPGSFQPGQDYIPRFGWVDKKTVWVVTLSRDHKHQNLYFADAQNGAAKLVLAQTDDKFFDEKYNLDIAEGKIVLSSWADGHMHIYLYGYDAANPLGGEARLERQLTNGDWDVDSVVRVDAGKKLVYYESNEGNLSDEQLWQVSFDGEKRGLTAEAGVHHVDFAPKGAAFIDTYSTRMNPPTVKLCQAGGACNVFWSTQAAEALHLKAPELLTVKAPDGITLYATLLLPEGKTDPASVPLILNPYGGPGVMEVMNSWSGGLLFDTLLAQHGFAVLHTDNRGSARRGRDFAQAAYHNFGPAQFADQLTVADYALAHYPQLDAKRQGWWGWSWGGTFTLYALTHTDRFRMGIAVEPVTDWHNYDSIYTERYMSEPQDFPEGYRDFSVVSSAAKLKGHLLLVHGTGDDNVHLQNSVQFIQELIAHDIPYDLQIYPRKTHSIAGIEARTHLYERLVHEFEEYLKPLPEPAK